MTKVPKLEGGQMITIAYFIGIVIILFIVYKILAATGLVKTAAKKKEEATEEAAVDTIRTSDIFDPEYARQNKKFLPLGTQKLATYTEELRKALRGWGTDEEAIFVVFGNLYNKCNISELAAMYQQKYKDNLKTVLLNDLSKEDAATLISIINKLPNC